MVYETKFYQMLKMYVITLVCGDNAEERPPVNKNNRDASSSPSSR